MLRGLGLITLVCLTLACTFNDERTVTERTVALEVIVNEVAAPMPPPSNKLRAITLNIAHGRKDSLNQWLVSEEQTRENLDAIADFLKQSNADVVALQEADTPSRWSGNFDHVAYLAAAAGYRYYVHTEHARILMGNYGTAILSKWPVKEALGLNYSDTPPTASKGFTLALIEWHNPDLPESPQLINIISVHLDFSRKSVRLRQIEEMSQVIDDRLDPLVLMGDFNSEWLAQEYMMKKTAETSRLHVFDPASDEQNTYKDKRLDWIMLSRRLEFTAHQVEQSQLSDHKAVVGDIAWRGEK